MFEEKSATELRRIAAGSDSDWNGCWEEEAYSAYAREEMERRGYNQIPSFDRDNGRKIKWAGEWF